MPRSMGHPDYVYTPWSAERKAMASAAAKERIRNAREGDPRINPVSGDVLLSASGFEVHVIALRGQSVLFRYSTDESSSRHRRVTRKSWAQHFKTATIIHYAI